jgi:hypothetical protein
LLEERTAIASKRYNADSYQTAIKGGRAPYEGHHSLTLMPKLWVRDLAGLHCLIRVRLAPIVSNTSHQAIYIAIASPFMPVRFGVKQAMTVHSFIGPQLDNYGQYRALSFADPDRRLSETLLAFKPGIVLVHYWSRCHDQCALWSD